MRRRARPARPAQPGRGERVETAAAPAGPRLRLALLISLGVLLIGNAFAWRVIVGEDAQGATPTQLSAAAAPATPRQFSVAASGDLLIHSDLITAAAGHAAASGQPGYDFGPMLEQIKPTISTADLALCHMEVAMVGAAGPFTGYPSFGAPPQLAQGVAQQGYDGCSTASNHTIDRGVAGVTSTLDALDAAGLGHTGSARSKAEANTVRTYRPLGTDGPAVAHLSYTYGLNGLVPPADKPWLVNLIDPEAILRDATVARQGGANVVIVSLHWGQEYQSAPTPQQRELAQRLLASPDVDLILGHHAHVVQPVERINGKWVAFGMGNLIASPSHNHADGASREGIVPTFTFAESAPGSGRFHVKQVRVLATYTAGRPIRVVPLDAGVAGQAGTPSHPSQATQPGDADPARLAKARQRTTRTLNPTTSQIHLQ